MNICITAQGPTLDSPFEHHFARAPYFIFCDTATGKQDTVRNGFVASDAGLGRNAVDLLKQNGLEAVITGETGEHAKSLLEGAGIRVCRYDGTGTARDALNAVLATYRTT